MSRVGDGGRNVGGGNIVSFAGQTLRLDEKRKVKAAKKSLVSAADNSDAEAAGTIVMPKYVAFSQDPGGRELLGFVLDGKTTEERTDDEEDRIDAVVERLKENGAAGIAAKVVFRQGEISGKSDGTGVAIQVVTHFDDEQNPTVILSRNLGFRDSILSAHLAYADLTVHSARQMGVAIPAGDVGRQLSETVASGNLAEMDPDGEQPELADIQIDGETLRGLPR